MLPHVCTKLELEKHDQETDAVLDAHHAVRVWVTWVGEMVMARSQHGMHTYVMNKSMGMVARAVAWCDISSAEGKSWL